MKLSLLHNQFNLKLTLTYIYHPIRTSADEWFSTCSPEQVTILSFLISQLVLQCSIYSLVRRNNKFDVKHFDLIKGLIVKIVEVDLKLVKHPGLLLAITTSKQIKRYKNVGLGEVVVIDNIVNMFDEAETRKSDKLTIMIFEQIKLAILDARKFINKTNKFTINDQPSLFDQDSNNAFF